MICTIQINTMTECSICLCNLEDDSLNGVYTINKCNHKFHTECYITWCTQGSFSCPLCRHDPSCNYMKSTQKYYCRIW